jgi:hypothetical protein
MNENRAVRDKNRHKTENHGQACHKIVDILLVKLLGLFSKKYALIQT